MLHCLGCFNCGEKKKPLSNGSENNSIPLLRRISMGRRKKKESFLYLDAVPSNFNESVDFCEGQRTSSLSLPLLDDDIDIDSKSSEVNQVKLDHTLSTEDVISAHMNKNEFDWSPFKRTSIGLYLFSFYGVVFRIFQYFSCINMVQMESAGPVTHQYRAMI